MSVPSGQMLAMLSQMSPDQVQGIMGLGNTPDEQALLMQQMQRARALQNTPMPQGQSSWRGQVYTKPSPLAVAGAVANQAVGQGQANQIAGKQQALMNNSTLQRQNYFNLLMKMYGSPGASGGAGGGGGGGSGDQGTPEGGDL